MAEPEWKSALRSDLERIAGDIERGNGIQGGVDYARQDLEHTVFEAVEAAYKRGHDAGASRSGRRVTRTENHHLTQENERLRAELDTAQRHLDARRIELLRVNERHADETRHYEIAARAVARVREYAEYHATQCEGWCCDHAPELRKLIDKEQS